MFGVWFNAFRFALVRIWFKESAYFSINRPFLLEFNRIGHPEIVVLYQWFTSHLDFR